MCEAKGYISQNHIKHDIPETLDEYLKNIHHCGYCGRLVYGYTCRDEGEPCDCEIEFHEVEQYNKWLHEKEMSEQYEQLAQEWIQKGWM